MLGNDWQIKPKVSERKNNIKAKIKNIENRHEGKLRMSKVDF